MCRMSSAHYDLYRRTNSGLGRSLFGWLRSLWRQHQPQVEQAEVVQFPETAERGEQQAKRSRPRAA